MHTKGVRCKTDGTADDAKYFSTVDTYIWYLCPCLQVFTYRIMLATRRQAMIDSWRSGRCYVFYKVFVSFRFLPLNPLQLTN